MQTSAFRGSLTVTSFRLCSRAPWTTSSSAAIAASLLPSERTFPFGRLPPLREGDVRGGAYDQLTDVKAGRCRPPRLRARAALGRPRRDRSRQRHRRARARMSHRPGGLRRLLSALPDLVLAPGQAVVEHDDGALQDAVARPGAAGVDLSRP